MTKFQLMAAFLNRQPIVVNGVHFWVLNSLAHEDGSGRSFNVCGYVDHNGIKTNDQVWVHVRTID